jgi:hypothetical protein
MTLPQPKISSPLASQDFFTVEASVERIREKLMAIHDSQEEEREYFDDEFYLVRIFR